MRIVIDRERCTGHGRCYSLVPEVFEPDDNGYGEVGLAGGELPPDLEERARVGVANCPERAIEITA